MKPSEPNESTEAMRVCSHAGLRTAAPAILGGLLLIGAMQTQAATPDKTSVLETYADIAHAKYEDSLTTARTLDAAIDSLIAKPSDKTLQAAKDAWIAARVPYQQSEAYRFGNPVVDDWEGKVNAWPLDEGLIDYVDQTYGTDSDENPFYVANIVANSNIRIGGSTVDASVINAALLQELHEIDEIEANVSTGYHAIEFLLWGQDLNGTGPGAGQRPATDYDTANCTNGNCDRRAAYLKAASTLLLDDLAYMTAQWAPDGPARAELVSGDANAGLTRILTGMGSLSYGELAGERMKLGLMLHDPEEEHDCFSDNTHNSHFYDALGIQNVYLGQYRRVDGSMVKGASLASLLTETAPKVDDELRAHLTDTLGRMQAIVDAANSGRAYDQLLAEGADSDNALIDAAVDALKTQTRSIERAVAALGLQGIAFEGSDSLDNPQKVLQ